MTLVVGKLKDNRIKFLSDSKMTDKNSVSNNPLCGNLKSFIIDPQVCVNYSGNPYYAEKLLKEFYSNKISTAGQLFEFCISLNIESNNETFFSIGTLYENEFQLLKISNGIIENMNNNVWIGDKLGFSNYQKYYLNSNEKDDFFKMITAFNLVAENEEIKTVGDFVITVESYFHDELKKHLFQYGLSITLTAPPLDSVPKENHIFEFGDREKGAFVITYFRSLEIINQAVAVFFPVGKFGVLFCPKINYNEPIIIKKSTGLEFINEILSKYEIHMEGATLSDNGKSIKLINNLP